MKLTQSEKIRIFTARQNMTLNQVYNALKISRQQGYHKLCCDKFTAQELGAIAEYLNVKINDLRSD